MNKSKNNSGAIKYDSGKAPMHLVPLEAVEQVAKVLGFGAKKYAPNGWKSLDSPIERYTSALLRHLTAIQAGENLDPDSGLPHIDHVACNALFLSWFNIKGERSAIDSTIKSAT